MMSYDDYLNAVRQFASTQEALDRATAAATHRHDQEVGEIEAEYVNTCERLDRLEKAVKERYGQARTLLVGRSELSLLTPSLLDSAPFHEAEVAQAVVTQRAAVQALQQAVASEPISPQRIPAAGRSSRRSRRPAIAVVLVVGLLLVGLLVVAILLMSSS